MATVRVKCDGAKWQDDYARVHEQVADSLSKSFGRWCGDKDEAVQEAMCWFMEMFATRWKQGRELVLKTDWACQRVFQRVAWVRRPVGAAACGQPKGRKVDFDLALLGARTEASDVDLEDALAKLSKRQRFVVRKVMEGWSLREIERRWHIDRDKAQGAVETMLTLL